MMRLRWASVIASLLLLISAARPRRGPPGGTIARPASSQILEAERPGRRRTLRLEIATRERP